VLLHFLGWAGRSAHGLTARRSARSTDHNSAVSNCNWYCRILQAVLLGILLVGVQFSSAQTNSYPEQTGLPVMLANEGRSAEAALEFRRRALDADNKQDRGHILWAAAYEYWKAGNTELAEKMLDQSEDTAQEWFPPRPVLRSEIAITANRYEESDYYLECLIKSDAPADYRNYAARRLAVADLRRNNASGAGAALRSAPNPDVSGLDALEKFRHGSDKSPMLGGLLGIVPGLGYFYSGEYASGARSIILNGLFIWGMVSTADRDQWGLFGVITFGEITWYSGSIYGGVDAASRYNRRRSDECERGIMGNAGFEPDWSRLPLIELKFRF